MNVGVPGFPIQIYLDVKNKKVTHFQKLIRCYLKSYSNK